MLVESVSVKNFKLFGDFAVGGLRPFTLLGGDNGCGKTTLLEAVFICLNKFWTDSNVDELVVPILRPLRDASIGNENAFAYLAHGGEFSAPIVVSCHMGGKKETVQVSPCAEAMAGMKAMAGMIKTESGVYIPQPVRAAEVKYSATPSEGEEHDLGRFVVIADLNGIVHVRPPDEKKQAELQRNPPFPTSFRVIMYMPDGGLSPDAGLRSPDIWSRLPEDKQTAVKEVLRIIEPRATDIGVESTQNKPYLAVKIDGMSRKTPAIVALGAGGLKLLSLALALHSVENAVCLLDEVTTGWHHSHLADLWRVIFRICKERNHQVIATTHSYEGITAFAEAATAENAEGDACYVRLLNSDEFPNGKNRPEPFEHGDIVGVNKAGLELR